MNRGIVTPDHRCHYFTAKNEFVSSIMKLVTCNIAQFVLYFRGSHKETKVSVIGERKCVEA